MNNQGPDYWLFFYLRDKIELLKLRNRRKNFKNQKISIQKLYDIYSHGLCFYCSKKCIVEIIDQSHNKLKHNSATVDRVDPLIGYDDSNIVLACHKCNNKKSRKDQQIVENFREDMRAAHKRLD